MSNPTGMLLGTDQKKYLTEDQNKLQLGLAKEIATNGFNCNFKPQRKGFKLKISFRIHGKWFNP